MALATRLAATRPRSRTAFPPTRSTAGSPERSALAAPTTASSSTVARTRAGVTGGGVPRLAPRHVGGDDQGGHAAGGAEGTLDGVDGVGGEGVGGRRRPEPARHRAGQALDVRGQRGVVGEVGGGVVADHVDDGGPGPPGVVEVGDAVAEARARGATTWRPGAAPSGRSRRRRRSPPLRRARARPASRARRRARPRSASPRSRGWRSRRRPRCRRGSG